MRGSSARVMPESTSTVARPPRLPMTMSVSIRSPTMTASAAGTASLASAVSRMIGDGLPTITSTVAPVTASTAAIMPAQSGISPSSVGQVRSGLVAINRAPARTAWSAVLSFA